MTPTQTAQQIRDITLKLVMVSLVDHQNEPSVTRAGPLTHIGIAGSPDLSASLKDVPYEEVYKSLLAAGAYHLRMIDGALVQFLYCFQRRTLVSHHLAFFPSPSLRSYDEAAQIYEDDELFGDIFVINAVRTPMRFDFDASEERFVEVDHPKCHLTLGQYRKCRIPVTGPLTPFRFSRFILRNFYNPAYAAVNMDQVATETAFDETIGPAERLILHVAA